MRAVVWHGKEDVRVDDAPDPRIEEPTDAVIRVTSTAICGSDLHLYSKLWPALKEGDILGHEAMGIVEEVGPDVTHIRAGDRVVIPFNIACGQCWQCKDAMYSQCDTTQNKAVRKGASLFGYTHLYGGVPGGQAEYLRVPQAHFGPVPVPEGPPDSRFLFLSDVPADGLAGGRLRGHPAERHSRRSRTRPDRPDVRAHRPPSGRIACHRDRPRTGTAGDGGTRRVRDGRRIPCR
jgi:threonine dehydrogenase-like Zn-dependent dehydrogenase